MTFEEFMDQSPEDEGAWNLAYADWETARYSHYMMQESKNLVEEWTKLAALDPNVPEAEARLAALENMVLSIAASLKIEQEIAHWQEGVALEDPRPQLTLVEPDD